MVRDEQFCFFQRGQGGLGRFDHEFPFFRDVKLVERSLNEPQMKYHLPRGVWWSSPKNLLASVVPNGAFQCHFGSLYSNTPTPSPSNLFRFILISRMDLGVGKKSEIKLKSENFDPCIRSTFNGFSKLQRMPLMGRLRN